MSTLASAGVRVTVSDQSIYSEPNPTTIPLFVFATRANKTTPDGAGTALGTTESNKLRMVGSQRELLQNYGNPVFVTSAGDPVFDEETNEFGLLAAWSFLGRGSRAFVMRADLNLGELLSTQSEPVLPPPDMTYWINQPNVVGGIFQFDGSVWNPVPFSVYTASPTTSDGSDGDWAFDYSTLNGTILYKIGGNWKPATDSNLASDFGVNVNLHVTPTAPVGPDTNDFWYKTTSSGGGVNLALTRFRASDGNFVTVPVIRDIMMPTPNQGVVWEDISNIGTTGARPLLIGNGEQFIPLQLFVQPEQPVTEPDDGTLWFDDTLTDFALYVEGTEFGRGDQWVPVETTTVSSPTALQKVISGSPPAFPEQGAIWVDLSTPENIDNYPVVKRRTGTDWVDITPDIEITDEPPVASAVINGTYWLNLGESRTRNTVRRYDSEYVPATVVLNTGTNMYEIVNQNFPWRPATGDTFGRKSQREIVVEMLQAAFVSNDEIRAETNYFQLMSCPGYPELYDEMLALNTDNGETAFIVADPPKFMIPSGIPQGREVSVSEWVTNANNVSSTGELGFSSGPSPYAGIWYPWCLTTNVNGDDVFAPPSHIALRTIAFSDSVAAPWFPPAGYTRGRVDNATSVGFLNNDSEYVPLQMTQSMRDVAYENNINPIADIPNRGLVVFGQKTQSAVASSLDRVNVARLVAKMKYDLERLLEPFLFEINDPITRRSAQVVTERYLAGLKSLRAVFDYAVRCDESNNTPDRIDQNQLYVDVAIQPARSIEFIFVPITLLNTGEEFPF